MAVPSLWPWVACLLVVLLSLGLGLDTLEGESPAGSWSCISLPASREAKLSFQPGRSYCSVEDPPKGQLAPHMKVFSSQFPGR